MPSRRAPLLALAIVVAVLAMPARALAAAPSVSVSPTLVLRGSSLLVTGAGWPGRARVELLVGPPRSEASHVAWVTTTRSGRLRTRLPIARRATTGRFVLLACRRACRVKAQASFRILAGSTGGR